MFIFDKYKCLYLYKQTLNSFTQKPSYTNGEITFSTSKSHFFPTIDELDKQAKNRFYD